MTTEEKVLPINKYSPFELKAGIDKEIQSYLEDEDFDEIQQNSNLKIFVGLLNLACTAIAYLYPYITPKSFEQYYYVILGSVVGHFVFSTAYFLMDNKLFNTIFYVGSNEEYFENLITKKDIVIEELTVHSDIDENKFYIYKIWFDFSIEGKKEKITTEQTDIDCTRVYDERGYIHRDQVIKYFKDVLKAELSKI